MSLLRSLGCLSVSAVVFAACAAGKTIDDGGSGGVNQLVSSAESGTGGSGGMAASSGAMSSSSSGPPGSCVKQADCAALADACHAGNCVNGMCEQKAANDGSACDDGLYCTDNDACQSGTCVGGTQKFCPSPDSCHVGACDEATKACGSAPGNDGASCDDGDPCTYSGTCSQGTCSKGQQVDCSAFNGTCSDGVCDPVLGCVAKPKNDGASCDDGLFCTVQDVCMAGACSGVPNTCSDPIDAACMIATCNEAQKSCVAVPGNDGKTCDDGNPCTVSETCGAGKCVGGVPGNQGMMCDDGDGCTSGTTCNGGVCGNPQSQILQCIASDSCCPAGCDVNSDNDCVPPIRPNLLLCGPSSRNIMDFANAVNQPFNFFTSCTPDSNTQAMVVTRSFGGAIDATILKNYLDAGGVVLTEYDISWQVWNLAFDGGASLTNSHGSCQDTAPTVYQFNANDPFWAANPFMQIGEGQSGCGYEVNGFPGITPLAGWNANAAAIGYRDRGLGRVWATDFDWQDGENNQSYGYTNQLMGYMITHRK